MKILVGILVGLGAFGLIAIVALVLVGRSLSDRAREARTFAADATHAECADEIARRTNACEELGVSCIMEISLFGPTCFGAAKQSEGEEFCATVPVTEDRDAFQKWSSEFCPPRELAESECSFVGGLLSGLCAGARPAPEPSVQSLN